MSGHQSDPIAEAGKAFTDALDREGHSFQYSVLRALEELVRKPKNYHLTFEVSELPVSTRGRDSRVDFILRVKNEFSGDRSVLLVCECKRANPALNNWMFARAPFVRRNPGPPVVIGELLERASGRSAASVTTVYYRPQREPFHIGLPVKLANAKSGTANGSGRDVIEHAATQVITCLNGFADFIHRDLVS